MAAKKENRIAEALHVLVDEVLAPFLTGMADPSTKVEIIEALLTKQQVAKALNASVRTVERLIKTGQIVATNSPSGVRIEPSEVDRYKRLNQKE